MVQEVVGHLQNPVSAIAVRKVVATMNHRRSLIQGCTALAVLFSASPSFAQQANNGSRILGVIDQLDGQKLTVKPLGKNWVKLKIADDAFVARTELTSLTAIKKGDYIASLGVKSSDGKLHALELRVFPTVMVGLGEGQRKMNGLDQIMTNATVSEVLALPEGQLLKIKFNGESSELVVEPKVPIHTIVVSSVSELKVGATVSVGTVAGENGDLIANRIVAQ